MNFQIIDGSLGIRQVPLTSGYVTMFPIKLITLFLLILLMLSSVLPAIKIHSCSGQFTHEELVRAHNGEMILAVHRKDESLLTTKEMLENSPTSTCVVEFDPHAGKFINEDVKLLNK